MVTANQWPGPRPYTDELTEVFHGREKDISHLLTQLQGQRLSLMTASSGAGKTSILQAGVVPRIREFRIGGRRIDPHSVPVAPFPILLNEWLERANKGDSLDYAQLVALEIHKYLLRALSWYERRLEAADSDETARAIRAEITAIQEATAALARHAVDSGFAYEPDSLTAQLRWRPNEFLPAESRDTIVDCLLRSIDVVTDYLGEVLLVLDQFEEVLLDWKLGQQALDAVEGVFLLRRTTARQLISMRHDGLHLVDPLEAKDLLENKRRVKIEPLSPSAVRQVIVEVSLQTDITWQESLNGEPPLLDRLIESFTQTKTGAGVRAGEVNLVGLQVVLNAVVDGAEAGSIIDSEHICRYANRLSSNGERCDELGYWLEGGSLVRLAPKDWIVQCLDGEAGCCPENVDDVVEHQVQPLAARMAWLLVTPAGNKRPMTSGELHHFAYGEDMQLIDEDDPSQDFAGRARAEAWTLDDYTRHMSATCDEALRRLTSGNVLKKRGSESGSDVAYELVHDQFGGPFQDWARDFEKLPEYDLNSLQAIKSRLFKWTGESLRPHDDDGVIPYARWEDCTLREVDLSGLTFSHCDFGESLFEDCTLNDVNFEECDLTNVAFKRCRFDSVKMTAAQAASIKFRDCTLKGLVVEVGPEASDGKHGMSFAQISKSTLSGCRFSAAEGLEDAYREPLLLSLDYVQITDCTFEGTVEFARCSLDGGAIRGLKDACNVDGTLLFTACSMSSFEVSNVDARGQRLKLTDCDCRGASFDRVNGGPDESGKSADLDFDGVTLVGATMKGCVLEDVHFKGHEAADGTRTDISAFSITDRPADSRHRKGVPSKISNIAFTNLDAENLSIERCHIQGNIDFHKCMLSGATFLGDPGVSGATRRANGSVAFDRKCDLTAVEFSGLAFVDGNTLTFDDCDLGGAVFYDVQIHGLDAEHPGGVFTRCDLAGALFLGADLRHVHFLGQSDKLDDAPTLVARPGRKAGKRLPTVMDSVLFRWMAMPGFVFEDVRVDGDICFDSCDLGGGTIGHVNPKDTSRITVGGDLSFENCRMDAIELNHLQFTDESIQIKSSQCDNARFHEIGFELVREQEDGLLIDDSNMSGALFLDCEIKRATLSGITGELTEARAVMFHESENDRAELSSALIENYVLDGGLFEGLVITGEVIFRSCSLLRTKFSGLDFDEGAVIDVRESDLLYAQIDAELLESTDRFLLTHEQREALSVMMPFEESLRHRLRK